MTACRICLAEKPLDEFYFRKETGSHRPQCKSCWNQKTLAWHKANPEARKGHVNKWEDSHPDNIKKRKATYRAKHPIGYRKWSLENPELKKALNDSWKARNKHRANEYSQARRAAIINATPSWADREEMQNIYLEARYFQLHVDHIVPLVSHLVCGLNVEHNLQLLTPAENMAKSNRYWPDMP